MPDKLEPFPVLVTQRLLLRQLTLYDTGVIYRLRSDPEVNKFLDRPLARSSADAEEFIRKINDGISRNDVAYWGITQKGTDILLGTICLWNFSTDKLKAETGYELLPEFQGNGFIREALKAVVDYGFGILGLNCIDALVFKGNTKSISLLNFFGFIKMHEGEELLYSLLKK